MKKRVIGLMVFATLCLTVLSSCGEVVLVGKWCYEVDGTKYVAIFRIDKTFKITESYGSSSSYTEYSGKYEIMKNQEVLLTITRWTHNGTSFSVEDSISLFFDRKFRQLRLGGIIFWNNVIVMEKCL